MKIVFEHQGILPVKKYGGTERIIFWLMKELVLLGHKVVLIGNPKSQVASIGVELITCSAKENWIDKVPADADIVHLFYKPNDPNNRLQKKLLVTIEGNGRVGEEFPLNTVFVSKKHAENHGSIHYVYNGIDLSEYPFETKKLQRKNFAFLAKARWKVKNVAGCALAAKKCKVHLHVAGGRVWTLSHFVHSYGMVGQKKKLEILAKCDALLFPVRWHEPFGIAIVEAMSQGLPVIGGPYGSLPELINYEGKSYGAIAKDQNHLESLIKSEEAFQRSPEEMREYVKKRFSSKDMALSYVNYYQKIKSGEQINEKNPSWKLSIGPLELLPF